MQSVLERRERKQGDKIPEPDGHCALPSTSPGNVISGTVGLVDINVQPEYELLSSTRFGQFQKFGKNLVAALPLSHA